MAAAAAKEMPHASSSTSPKEQQQQNNNLKDSEPCLICRAPTLERHFQVITCNACAAFFRRSIKIRSSYRCQRNLGMCNLSVRKVGRPLCRYCRLKKCFQIGMKADENLNKMQKFKAKEELHSSPSSSLSKDGEEKMNTCPRDFLKQQRLDKTSGINVEKVYQEVKAILEQNPKCFSAMDNFNSTKKFAEALSKFCVKPKDLTLSSQEMDFRKRTKYVETYIINTANLLMNIEYYATLPFSEKFALYKRFWQMFQIIEKCYLSFIYFGNNPDDTRYIVDQEHYIDIEVSQDELEKREKLSETTVFLYPLFSKTKLLLRQVKITSITIFEFAYICQLILWSSTEVDDLTPQTHKLAEEMISKASDELHDYYVNDMHMLNYAARQAELIKHVKLTEIAFRDKKQLMAANQIFNFIEHNLRFSILT